MMNLRDPKLIALLFNECINKQDIKGLSDLMTEDHAFIDREGKVHEPKSAMVDGWQRFFETFPKYKNTFTRLESRGNEVTILGHAFWSESEPYDPVIWTARVERDHIAEWRVHVDSEENRKTLGIL
ncbi:MAG: nuclear transport factor 2 family protein [Ignavibacteria bacterium]|nr:nuclear transport factor 2 family protein [Ignavibacteria bacterium]